MADRTDLLDRILAAGAEIDGGPIVVNEGLCHRLREAGVCSGDGVVLEGLSGRDLLFAALAAWRCDAVPIPLAASLPDAVAGSCRVLRDGTVLPGTGGVRGLDATAVLHLSSGSTDQPKIVRRGVQSVLREAEGYREGMAWNASDRVAIPLPLVHSLGWGVALSALLTGVSVDVTQLVRAESLARKADSGAVSVLALTAPIARLLAATRRRGMAVPRVAVVGAGPVSDELDAAFLERFGIPLLRGYGSTETGGTFLGPHGMGQPVSGVDIVEPGASERGELVLRLAAPVQGYLGGTGSTHLWQTGDVVDRDARGEVRFIARARGPLRLNDRFVNIDPVDRALRGAEGVTDVYLMVLRRPGVPDVEDFYAIVEGEPSDETLRDQLARCPGPLPRVVRCTRLPRTTMGKPDRSALIELVRQQRKGDDHA